MMTCREARSRILPAIDGSMRIERVFELEQHLRGCDDCRARYEEARACWQSITAPVLWVDAADSEIARRMKLGAADYAERRNAHRNLRYVTVEDAGHMLHHDQPERVAHLIADFMRGPAG